MRLLRVSLQMHKGLLLILKDMTPVLELKEVRGQRLYLSLFFIMLLLNCLLSGVSSPLVCPCMWGVRCMHATETYTGDRQQTNKTQNKTQQNNKRHFSCLYYP